MDGRIIRNKKGKQYDGAKTSAKNLKRLERRAEMLRMREAGKTYDQIAQEFDVTPGRVCQIVTEELERHRQQMAECVQQIRYIEATRLEKLQNAVWSKALAGNGNAVGTVLRIMERRAKLLGLDAIRVAPTSSEGTEPKVIEYQIDVSKLSRQERELYKRLTEKAINESSTIDIDVEHESGNGAASESS